MSLKKFPSSFSFRIEYSLYRRRIKYLLHPPPKKRWWTVFDISAAARVWAWRPPESGRRYSTCCASRIYRTQHCLVDNCSKGCRTRQPVPATSRRLAGRSARPATMDLSRCISPIQPWLTRLTSGEPYRRYRPLRRHRRRHHRRQFQEFQLRPSVSCVFGRRWNR